MIEGWCDEGTELEHAAENGVKRDEVGRGSRLYKADIAKKQSFLFLAAERFDFPHYSLILSLKSCVDFIL